MMKINRGLGKVQEFEFKTGKVRKLNKLENSRIYKTNNHKHSSDLFYFYKWFMIKDYTCTYMLNNSHTLRCFS